MKRGCPDHPKVYDLCERLRVRRPTAVGYLELLWHFTAKYAPQGDIGRFSDTRIEAGLDWGGKPGKLIEALVGAGWLDRHVPATASPLPRHSECRLVVHDWHEHADDAVRKRLSRMGQQFIKVTPKVTGYCPDTDRDSADSGGRNPVMSRLPEPVPVPVPVPEPGQSHTQAAPKSAMAPPCVCVMPTTADANTIAGRFPEWIGPWPRVADPESALRNWLSRVTPETVECAFACRNSYLESDEVRRGVVQEPWKFIRTQADCGWTGKWPPARSSDGASRRQAAIDAEWLEVTNGQR